MASELTTRGVSRRALLKAGGAFGVLAMVSLERASELLARAPLPGQDGHFLDAHELDTLRALCSRLIPGPPDDADPGAVETKVPEAIDMLLAAFEFKPPLIHTGGPWSSRGGSRRNDMKRFYPLDRQAELGWRIRIEGTRGLPEREFAGPVEGLQDVYRKGLAHLDERARGLGQARFASASKTLQETIMRDKTDGAAQHFVGIAFGHSIDFMYGPPEYGGNQGLAGWRYTGWDGDVSPNGFTEAELAERDDETGPVQRARPTDAELLAMFERHVSGLTGLPVSRAEHWRGFKGLPL